VPHARSAVEATLPRCPITYGVVSTFPPTPCGVATFARSLADGLAHGTDEVVIVAVGAPTGTDDPRVVARLDDRTTTPSLAAVAALGETDIIVVQHEYGLYAGADGEGVLELMAHVDRPTIVVAHTVLSAPSAHQRRVLIDVADAADAVVVMTEAARRRLCGDYGVEPWKVSVIPHGAAAVPTGSTTTTPTDATGPALTWGLLGPGKGIEWAIDAIGLLGDMGPPVRYLVAGDTHPKVRAAHGDAYLDMLRARVRDSALDDSVRFTAGYRDSASLAALIRSASFVILPYDSPDQVTSGVLVDAVAAGRPVIATAFPHAEELLASGAGIVVPRRDPAALAEAIRRMLTEPGLRDAMAAEAARIAPDLSWPAVADRYAEVASLLLANREAVTT
jgi:polysaccharide biosynthesis protein PslF